MRNLLIPFLTIFLISSCSEQKHDHQLKPPKNYGIYVIAHRGAHNGIPENTLVAYQKAIDLGADFVEVDIRTSSDGEFVSIHNRTIDAYVEGKTGLVHDYTLAELKSLDVGKRIGPQWEKTRIPTFKEILDLCKGNCGIYLDLKDAPIPALVALIKEKDMINDVLWCISDYKEMSELMNSCPECILMPDPGDLDEFTMILKEFNPVVVAPVWSDLSQRLIQMSKNAAALVFVDERDPQSWEQALKWGVDGIQTDHPEKLIRYLTTMNQ